MSEQRPRRKGRAVPAETGQRRPEREAGRSAQHRRAPHRDDLAASIDDLDIPTEAMAAVSYLMQRGRFMDMTEAVSRIERTEEGRLRFWLNLGSGQPLMEVDSQEVVDDDPARLTHRQVVMVTERGPGEEMSFSLLTAFRPSPHGLNADIALQALALVQQEIGESGVERMAQQWLRGGPWAWLDPEQPGDASLRMSTADGPGDLLDDEALRRAALGGNLPKLGT